MSALIQNYVVDNITTHLICYFTREFLVQKKVTVMNSSKWCCVTSAFVHHHVSSVQYQFSHFSKVMCCCIVVLCGKSCLHLNLHSVLLLLHLQKPVNKFHLRDSCIQYLIFSSV